MDAVPVLCLLGILGSLAIAIDTTVPPEDIDGSGDDEDYSGSGSDVLLVDLESNGVTVFTTSVSALVPTVEGSTAAQEPEVVDKEETNVEVTTKSAETTKSQEDIIEDLFAVDTVPEVSTPEATTSPSQRSTTADLAEENDTKKHHHHHHHHHHHNHTTTTTIPPTSEPHGEEDSTAGAPLDAGEPVDLPEETTTSIPNVEAEVDHVPQEPTTPVEDLPEHGGIPEETTSGSTSSYPDNDEATVEPLGADFLPEMEGSETTTAEPHTSHHPHHHHHHHHHPHHTTASAIAEGDVQQEVTTSASDPMEPEDNVQEGEPTTAVAEEEHPHHGHPHHTHHHKTTPSSTVRTEAEQPPEAHTHEPKGRRVHVPDVKSTTVVPVINEEEHVPEDTETDDLPSATVYYNVSRNPFDESDETSDSKEEGPSGVDEDIFFEATVPENKMGREDTKTDDGTSNASHGIMERKELLAGIIAGGVAGLVFAAFLVAFVLYRMKKKDEGSYSLEEPKQSNGGYQKPREQREFYA